MDARLRALERAAQTDPAAMAELALLRNRLGVCGLCGLVKNREPDSQNVFTMLRGHQIAIDPICLAEQRLLKIEAEAHYRNNTVHHGRLETVDELSPEAELGNNLWVTISVGMACGWVTEFPFAHVVAIDPFRAIDRENNTIRRVRSSIYPTLGHSMGFTVHVNKKITNSQRQVSTRVREAQEYWAEQRREEFRSEGRL